MNMQPVKSSNIEAVGYDASANELHVTFKGNPKTYHYYNVPALTFQEMMKSDSIGSFFSRNIKGNKSYAGKGE